MDEIRFWRSSDPFGCLSNFYAAPIEIDGKIWPTTEAYYQAMKFADESLQEFVRLAPNPKEAKTRAYQFPSALRADWDEVKESVMISALRAKISQHPRIREKLLESGNARLIEASPYDSYWGEGKDRKGQNRLGELLMQIRNEL